MKIDVWIEIDFLLFDLIFTSAERIPGAATTARSWRLFIFLFIYTGALADMYEIVCA